MLTQPPQVVRWLIPLLLLGASALLGLRVRKEKTASKALAAENQGTDAPASSTGKDSQPNTGKTCCEKPPSRAALFKEATPSTDPVAPTNNAPTAAPKP